MRTTEKSGSFNSFNRVQSEIDYSKKLQFSQSIFHSKNIFNMVFNWKDHSFVDWLIWIQEEGNYRYIICISIQRIFLVKWAICVYKTCWGVISNYIIITIMIKLIDYCYEQTCSYIWTPDWIDLIKGTSLLCCSHLLILWYCLLSWFFKGP